MLSGVKSLETGHIVEESVVELEMFPKIIGVGSCSRLEGGGGAEHYFGWLSWGGFNREGGEGFSPPPLENV